MRENEVSFPSRPSRPIYRERQKERSDAVNDIARSVGKGLVDVVRTKMGASKNGEELGAGASAGAGTEEQVM